MTSATSYQFVLIVVLRADKRYDINFGHKSRRPSLGKKSSGFFAPTTTAAGTTKLSNAGAKFQITASRAYMDGHRSRQSLHNYDRVARPRGSLRRQASDAAQVLFAEPGGFVGDAEGGLTGPFVSTSFPPIALSTTDRAIWLSS